MEKSLPKKESDTYFLYSVNPNQLAADTWGYYLGLLPITLQEEVLKYRRWQDQQNCLFGKLLLFAGYYLLKGEKLDFTRIAKNEFGKPFISDSFDFEYNISHTDTSVVCLVSKNPLGVDIEQIRAINLEDFTKVFSLEEQALIRLSDKNKFFELWTIKEAVAKANSKGLGTSFVDMIIQADYVICEGQKWMTKHFQLNDTYCALAFEAPLPEIEFRPIKF